MRILYLKILFVTCLIITASEIYGQFSVSTNTNIGQKFALDSVSATATFVVDFSTAKDSSFWTYDEATKVYTITVNKCQTQRGLQVNVYPDSVSTTAVINGDFECRDYGGNRNPARVKSVASLVEILEKFQIKNAGTADSVKNVPWKPSACLFDLNTTGTEQAFGAHPGMYKRVEYGFQYNFSGYSVTDADITFDIDTYDPGNTGKTASYKLIVATGSATGIIGEVNNFYVTGSGKKSVKVAAAIGKSPSEFNNKKVYIFLKTLGTGTPIDKAKTDPVVIFDNLKVSYVLPSWVSPAAGIKGNAIIDNSTSPFAGELNKEGLFSLNLKTAGRLGTFSIINNWVSYDTRIFTFPETGAVKARDASGKYTVDVPYTFTAGSPTVKEKIEIAAPVSGKVNDDVMLFIKATPKSATAVNNRLELNCGVRIWYDLYIKGADVIDLSGVSKTTALADTLADVSDGAVILLGPGKTYNAGGFAFAKSVEIRSANPAADFPVLNCAQNFNIADASTIGSLVFKNLHLTGDYDNNYVFNIDKSGTVGEIRFESCKIRKMRGIVRMKGGTGTLEKFSVTDCMADSIKDYGVLAADINTWICNNILVQFSTVSKAIMLFTSRNNSQTVLLERCTFSEAPEKGRQMFRWREAGKDNVLKGVTIKNCLWGHGWNISGTTDYLLDGFDGMAATAWTINNSWATSEFGYGAGKDSIPGFPSVKYSKKAAELWVDPYKSNFNFLDKSFPGLGTVGDPRWTATITKAVTVEIPDDMVVYPNPARNYAKLRFNLSESSQVNVSLYAITGQKILAGTKQFLGKGINEIEINTANLKQGLYIYLLETDSGTSSGKLYITK